MLKKLSKLLVLTTIITSVLCTTEQELERILGKPDPRCPQKDVILKPVHLEHDYDCSKFYKCYNGRAFLMDCPGGTWWDPVYDNCGEKRGICMKRSIKAFSLFSDESCPIKDDPANPIHFPHPFECNLFFKCANGQKVLMECPPDLHWSIATDRCERPEDANCSAN
uniref:CSON014567 protein n=1 Tax=Culicoides sonorensis TaxID=179676 RepID=A0A336MAW2_CULSO